MSAPLYEYMVSNPWNRSDDLADVLRELYWWVYWDQHGGPPELHFIFPDEAQELHKDLCIPGHHFLMTLTLHNPLGWQGYRFDLVSTYAPATSDRDTAPYFRLHELIVEGGQSHIETLPFVAWRRRIFYTTSLAYLEARWHPQTGETLDIKGLEKDTRKGSIDKAVQGLKLLKAIEAVGRGRRPGPNGFKDVQEFEDTLVHLIQVAHNKGQGTKQERIAVLFAPELAKRRGDIGSAASVDIDIKSTQRLIRKHLSYPWKDFVKKALQTT